MSEADFLPVARVGEISVGGSKICEVAGRLVAVFNDGQRYHAIDDRWLRLLSERLGRKDEWYFEAGISDKQVPDFE